MSHTVRLPNNTMAEKDQQLPRCLEDHVAVRMKDCIVVFREGIVNNE